MFDLDVARRGVSNPLSKTFGFTEATMCETAICFHWLVDERQMDLHQHRSTPI
jgi:hypothetical protein